MAEFFDYDPDRGITTYFDHDELTDKTTIHRVQDVSDILDATRRARIDGKKDVKVKSGEAHFAHYAVIPAMVELELRKKGINIYDPSQTKEILKEINQNYPYLKVTEKHHAG